MNHDNNLKVSSFVEGVALHVDNENGCLTNPRNWY
jgi:hypothetical protein